MPKAKGTTVDPLAGQSLNPKKACDVWIRKEWIALCEHLHNGNEPMRFIMGFQGDDGSKEYKRSKKLPVYGAISWAWDSITGKSKSEQSYVPYAKNAQQKSRWGGIDFDAHN